MMCSHVMNVRTKLLPRELAFGDTCSLQLQGISKQRQRQYGQLDTHSGILFSSLKLEHL